MSFISPRYRKSRGTSHYTTVLIQHVTWKTCRGRWTIGISGGGGSGESVPEAVTVARHDDDDDICSSPMRRGGERKNF